MAGKSYLFVLKFYDNLWRVVDFRSEYNISSYFQGSHQLSKFDKCGRGREEMHKENWSKPPPLLPAFNIIFYFSHTKRRHFSVLHSVVTKGLTSVSPFPYEKFSQFFPTHLLACFSCLSTSSLSCGDTGGSGISSSTCRSDSSSSFFPTLCNAFNPNSGLPLLSVISWSTPAVLVMTLVSR